MAVEITNRFENSAQTVVPVARVPLPDIKFAMKIPRDRAFSVFINEHMEIAGRLIKIFLDQPNVRSLTSVALYCKDRINAYLFNYALSVAIYHREDTKNENVPSIVETFPDQFIEPSVFPRLREEGKLPESSRVSLALWKNERVTLIFT